MFCFSLVAHYNERCTKFMIIKYVIAKRKGRKGKAGRSGIKGGKKAEKEV